MLIFSRIIKPTISAHAFEFLNGNVVHLKFPVSHKRLLSTMSFLHSCKFAIDAQKYYQFEEL
jgi:hypothetical protein